MTTEITCIPLEKSELWHLNNEYVEHAEKCESAGKERTPVIFFAVTKYPKDHKKVFSAITRMEQLSEIVESLILPEWMGVTPNDDGSVNIPQCLFEAAAVCNMRQDGEKMTFPIEDLFEKAAEFDENRGKSNGLV